MFVFRKHGNHVAVRILRERLFDTEYEKEAQILKRLTAENKAKKQYVMVLDIV